MSNIKLYLKNIALPLGIGIVIGLLTMGGMEDFKLLSKPLLNPPSIVFPIVWTILYILMGISYTLLLTSGTNTKETKMAYFLQLFFNAILLKFFPHTTEALTFDIFPSDLFE